ncbi:NUDIX domain-containing protein [Halioglobus maricola]|uniref:NUDIX domain-containing protein n=1 Tax=Halioglobus maricola TaxID=2601894 RepID=A0A5P9NIC9_9GAMM|nr:NUDIX domain-containing protein [Halioglobus maricola]QFU75580.1 NUDIX domain-containing protein [Halioglobus maricola]
MKQKNISEFARRISKGSDFGEPTELIPAATVILLRDADGGVETLMLRKNSKIAFGGMWVFPGGRIDDDDGSPEDEMEHRARIAAAREAMEEASVEVAPAEMTWISHWTPPAMGNRRFNTWFFATSAPRGEVTIDDGEITESQWVTGSEALAQHAAGDIELAPPTYVTLSLLARYTCVADAMASLEPMKPRHYVTKIVASGDDLVAMWEGDVGYESGDAQMSGVRHRLVMSKDGFELDESGAV